MTTYWFTPRPQGVEHQHPYLVFDSQDHLHFPLTAFGKEISQRLAPKTVQTYLYAVLPWFSYLESDIWQCRAGNIWDAPPRQVRLAVEDYLVSKLRCKVQSHQSRFVDRDEPGQDQYIFGDDPPPNETPLYAFVRVFPEEQGVQCHDVYIAPSVHVIQASIQRHTNYIRTHPGVDPQRQPYTISLTDLQPFRNNWAALQLAT